jgi:hypothetical protein
MAAAALGSRNAETFAMLTPAILSIAWINQAAAWWLAPWLAPLSSQAPQAGRIA